MHQKKNKKSARMDLFAKFNIFLNLLSPTFIKLGTNYLLVKGIQVCSNKGPGPLQRGDNYKNVKMGLGHLKKNLFKNHFS
jgi:hypothetical protein